MGRDVFGDRRARAGGTYLSAPTVQSVWSSLTPGRPRPVLERVQASVGAIHPMWPSSPPTIAALEGEMGPLSCRVSSSGGLGDDATDALG